MVLHREYMIHIKDIQSRLLEVIKTKNLLRKKKERKLEFIFLPADQSIQPHARSRLNFPQVYQAIRTVNSLSAKELHFTHPPPHGMFIVDLLLERS